MDQFAIKALEEYNSDITTVRHGGINGKNFWNYNSSQFIFVPAFSFPVLPGVREYIFTATDCNGETHTFSAKKPTVPLTPIWKEIPVGMVELKVEGLHKLSGKKFVSGVRTFYKASPFPGRDALPPRACSYKECALNAYRYVFNDAANQYWLEHGKPDPNYYHNVYPSKMIGSVATAMIKYAELDPANADKAMKLATNAADYLLSITYGPESPLEGLPPTYSFKGLNKEIVDATAPAADGRKDMLMMIYPATAGQMYLKLAAATGETKYFEAARRIAEYYRDHILPNGSWYLLVSAVTGEHESFNCCGTMDVLQFLNDFYKYTGEECWHVLERTHYAYLYKTCLESYNWEGQFEDIQLSGNYVNLTHITADKMIWYIVNNLAEDEEMMQEAKQLMRYVEDQFVVWGEFAPWSAFYDPDNMRWYSPAGLEQYYWYVPIDASTALIMNTFLDVYEATGEELLLEKAKALGDSITRMQDPISGVIPTHWMKEDCIQNLENFWINCQIGTAERMYRLAQIAGEI